MSKAKVKSVSKRRVVRESVCDNGSHIPVCKGWKRNQLTEDRLKELGISYSYRALKPSDIRHNKSTNPARFNARLDKDLWETYALEMMDGREFTALLVNESGGSYEMVGGNHRIRAAEESNRKTLLCIVINISDPVMMDRLMFEDNRVQGKPPSREEYYLKALSMMSQHGWTVRTAAKEYSLHENTLRSRVETQELRVWFSSHGVDSGNIPQSSMMQLKKLLVDEPVLLALVRIINRHKCWAAQDVKEAVNGVRRRRSESAKLEYVDELNKSWATTKSSKKSRHATHPVRSEFRKALTIMHNILEDRSTVSSLQLSGIPKDEMADEAARVKIVASALSRLGKEMTK